jgi:AcrR family transcriptional regulator
MAARVDIFMVDRSEADLIDSDARGRRETQKRRLLDGAVEAANRDGWTGANVSAIIAAAGVSRPTFYDYFENRDACLIAALEEIEARLYGRVVAALKGADPRQALDACLRAFVEFAGEEPAAARFLMAATLAGGPTVLTLRAHATARVARLLDHAHEELSPSDSDARIESRLVVGGVWRVLAARLRRGEPVLPDLAAELDAWTSLYHQPVASQQWRTLDPATVDAQEISQTAGRLPPPRESADTTGMPLAAGQRQRILEATARLAVEKGYHATTVGDITRLAGVDGRPFYRLFRDKQDAFVAVHEAGFQELMNITASAFFSGDDWPERSWRAGIAVTRFLAASPIAAHIGFIEAYAIGDVAASRAEDSSVAFTIFLQEGYRHTDPDAGSLPSRLGLEATIACIFELIHAQALTGRTALLPNLLPHIATIWLTPFLGPAAADRFVAEQLPPTHRPNSRIDSSTRPT